jgi:hypothetical protein
MPHPTETVRSFLSRLRLPSSLCPRLAPAGFPEIGPLARVSGGTRGSSKRIVSSLAAPLGGGAAKPGLRRPRGYLDPGTGSMLVYALAGIIGAVGSALRDAWYAALSLISGQGGRRPEDLPDIVFHSEGGKYWQVFQPVIASLLRRGVPCAYVTPDDADPAFALSSGLFTAVRPGDEARTIAYLNRARCAIVVSTTPHLDIYMWRRSKGVGLYCHLFHAPTDVVYYERYAFDRYDALLTVGPFMERSVRALEAKRALPPKKLLETGCTYYDYMAEELAAVERGTEPPVVLYAPTWGPRSSLLRYGTAIVDALVGAGIQVILRPHPQFYVSHRAAIESVEKRYAGSSLVTFDRNRTGVRAMADSDALVTDLSGILFDYAFLTNRPIVLANAEAGVEGMEGEDLGGFNWDLETARALSVPLDAARMDALPATVRSLVGKAGSDAARIRDIRDGNIAFFGRAGERAAENILSLLGEGRK